MSLFDESFRRMTRRRTLQVGGLSALGLDVAGLAQLRALTAAEGGASRPRANSCVFLFLFGGPSHIDLWDMKPEAPVEIRGDFQQVATNVPGIEICEHLPLMAQQMDKICLLRSMTHHMPVHGPACSEVYSGREYFGPPVTDQARPNDWPSLSAMVTRFGERRRGLPNSVVLPWYTQFVGQDKRIAGQTGGRMGEEFNPFLVEGNPNGKEFGVEGLNLPQDISATRFARRQQLRRDLETLDAQRFAGVEKTELVETNYRTALSMLEEARVGQAFELERESTETRAAYGRTRIGQSLLLARRLVETGVSLVGVNWDDDHKDDKVSPHWDTHEQNFPKLKDRLSPPFDRAFSAFVADLADRGLLETTLVVALGEFGRTPKVGAVVQNGMTKKTGRDHWPHAFTVLLAGGGVRGGQVYGSTSENGGYVKESPVSPADLSATILQHLGVDPTLEYYDRFLQVRQRLSVGRGVRGLG